MVAPQLGRANTNWIESVFNAETATILQAGEVVQWATAGAQADDRSLRVSRATQDHVDLVAGVCLSDIPPQTYGEIVTQGFVRVRVGSGVVLGDALFADSTASAATILNIRSGIVGFVRGVAMQAAQAFGGASSGLFMAECMVDFRDKAQGVFGRYGVESRFMRVLNTGVAVSAGEPLEWDTAAAGATDKAPKVKRASTGDDQVNGAGIALSAIGASAYGMILTRGCFVGALATAGTAANANLGIDATAGASTLKARAAGAAIPIWGYSLTAEASGVFDVMVDFEKPPIGQVFGRIAT